MSGVTRLVVDNLRLDGNELDTTSGDLELQRSGNVILDNLFIATRTANRLLVAGASGEVLDSDIVHNAGELSGLTKLNVDNIEFNGNTISITNSNGNLNLSPNGTGKIISSQNINPSIDASFSLGEIASRFTSLYLSSGLSNGSSSIAMATLLSLSDILVGASNGHSLFYDGSKWVSSAPDSEITHSGLTGLGTDDHTQYALLAGRAGGQILNGSLDASENLTLRSTSNVTKGKIRFDSVLEPTGDDTINIGSGSFRIGDVYQGGELIGSRMQNLTSGTLPASSAGNIGRFVFATDNNKAYVDTGLGYRVLGVSKYVSDISFNGSETVKNVDVSSQISDARNCLIQLLDNANDFERLFVVVKATSASNVRIETDIPLISGSYRLIVME
jgi:hypothetical protein